MRAAAWQRSFQRFWAYVQERLVADSAARRAQDDGDVEATVAALLGDPRVREMIDAPNLRHLLLLMAGRPVEAEAFRLKGVWGVPGRPLWTLLDEDDISAMRGYLEPGQVWMRVDAFTAVRRDWPAVESGARLQRELLGSPAGRSGRPRGRRALSAAEERLIAEAAIDGSTPLTEVYRAGLTAGLWERDDRPLYDRRNLDRARRLLRRAGLTRNT